MSVFFTADNAGFDFEDDVELNALLEEFLGDAHVFFERELGAVEHVTVEEVAFAFGAAFGGGGEQGFEKFLDVLGMAVVGVEGDEDVVARSEAMGGFGEDDGTEGHVLDGNAGGKFTTAGADLDDAVGLGVGKGFEGSVEGGRRGDVDGRVGVATFLGGVQHGAILGGSGNGHGRLQRSMIWAGCNF